MFHTYPEALRYLYENIPMFQRVGAAAYKKDLTNTIRLCSALGDPQLKFRSVHVGGTNGKGSTSHMLASILQEAGYSTGLYTSPHLKSFTERIKVSGDEISQQFVVDFVNKVLPLIPQIQPSFFEITVAMTFDYFAFHKVDIAVVEVGLGGRLDSTNIINPTVSVITNIGWDHKDLLGDTLEKIAFEKAGIIKLDTPAVVSERQPNVQPIFTSVAIQKKSELHFASDVYKADLSAGNVDVYKDGHLLYSGIKLPLKGHYQRKNIPGVLKAVDVLNDNDFNITPEKVKTGLERVVINTGLKGRWQKLRESPLMICDTGHNIDGMREILQQIGATPFRQLHMVLGMVKDKDIGEILNILPRQANYYFCQANLPRALDASLLAEMAEKNGLHGVIIPDVNEAKNAALKKAAQDDLIFIGGSTFVVAEIEEL